MDKDELLKKRHQAEQEYDDLQVEQHKIREAIDQFDLLIQHHRKSREREEEIFRGSRYQAFFQGVDQSIQSEFNNLNSGLDEALAGVNKEIKKKQDQIAAMIKKEGKADGQTIQD